MRQRNSNTCKLHTATTGAANIKMLTVATVLGLLAVTSLSVLAGVDTATAHVPPTPVLTVETAEAKTAAEPIWFGSYIYAAEPGDNLTYLARRSVQLYLNNSRFKLQTAQIIAAETFIVQDLGAFELAVGQEVPIDVTLVGRSAYQASLLSEAEIERWAAYAPIRANLNHITPLSTPLALGGQVNTAEPAAAMATPTLKSTTAPAAAANATAAKEPSFYLLMLGGLIVVGIVIWVLALTYLRDTRVAALEEVRKSKSKDNPGRKGAKRRLASGSKRKKKQGRTTR